MLSLKNSARFFFCHLEFFDGMLNERDSLKNINIARVMVNLIYQVVA